MDVRLFVNCVPRVTTLMPLCLNSYDDSWKELVENPEKWWDNRSNKEVLSISFDDSNKVILSINFFSIFFSFP